MRKTAFCNAKTKAQITAQPISTSVFARWIEQSIYFLNPKFQAFSRLLLLYSPVCVGPCQKPRKQVFLQRSSNIFRDIIFMTPSNYRFLVMTRFQHKHKSAGINEPRCEKTGLRGFRPGPTQTGLYSHRRWLER